MVGSCHRKPSTAIPPKFQSFIAVFFFGGDTAEGNDSLVDNIFFPSLSQLFGRECGTVSLFRYAVEDGAQKQIVVLLSVRQFLDGMARAG